MLCPQLAAKYPRHFNKGFVVVVVVYKKHVLIHWVIFTHAFFRGLARFSSNQPYAFSCTLSIVITAPTQLTPP